MSVAHPSDSENWNPQEMKGLSCPAKPLWFNKYTKAPSANLRVFPKRLTGRIMNDCHNKAVKKDPVRGHAPSLGDYYPIKLNINEISLLHSHFLLSPISRFF